MEATKLFDVTGHVAVVTGGASGLGRAMADVMVANGAIVVIADIDGARAERVASGLRASGGRAEAQTVDVGDRARLQTLMDDAAAKYGRIDVVFANAGIAGGPIAASPAGRIAAIEAELWERVLKINLTSVLSTIQAVVPHMKSRRYGRIIATASSLGLQPSLKIGYPYATAKAAVINLIRQASAELAPDNILVNAIAPGPFHTDIAGGPRDPERDAAIASGVALKRIADPREIMGLALLLASPASSYITGSVMVIDGGKVL